MLYELRDLRRQYQGRVVLELPQLQVQEGAVYALLGPNGAGKTTLLSLLAFLDRPDAGVITFCGQTVRYEPEALLPLRRQVVLVDQYPLLFSGKVWRNVEYGLKVRGVGKSERRQQVTKMLDLVGMADFAEAEAPTLSGGETKRVAMAMALAVRPRVLLLDEPTAGVDAENQQKMLELLAHINQQQGTTIIFSTHYRRQSQRLAQHILALDFGRLVDPELF